MTETPAALGPEAIAPVVTGLIRLTAPNKPENIDSGQHLAGDLGFHSLLVAELGYNLEELFDLRPLGPEEAMSLERVGDLVDLVAKEVADGAAILPTRDAVVELFGRYDAEAPAL